MQQVVKALVASVVVAGLSACGGAEPAATPTTAPAPVVTVPTGPLATDHLCVLAPDAVGKVFAAYQGSYTVEPGVDLDADGRANDCSYVAAPSVPQPRLRWVAYEPAEQVSMSTNDEYPEISIDSYATAAMQSCVSARKPVKKGYRAGFCQKYRGATLVASADGTVGWLFTETHAVGYTLEGVTVEQGRAGYLAATRKFLRQLAENQAAATPSA